MSEQKHKLLSLLAVAVLLLGPVLPATVGLAFADDQNQGSDDDDNETNEQGDGNDDDAEDEDEGPVAAPQGLLAALNSLPQCSGSCQILSAEFEDGTWEVEAVNTQIGAEVEAKFTSAFAVIGTPEIDESHEVQSHDRTVEVEANEEEATFKLKGATDEFEMKFKASDVTLKLEFKREASAEAEFESKVVFKELVEYRDVEGGQANKFDPGIDEVIGSPMVFESLNWTIGSPTDIATNSSTGKQINATATLPNGGNITLVFKSYGTFTTEPGVPLWPTSMKIDIIINYPMFAENSTGLALLVKTELSTEGLTGISLDESGLMGSVQATFQPADNQTLTFLFQWLNTLESGEEVTATVVRFESEPGEIETRVFLNYPKITSIVHDPQVGLVIRTPILPGPTLLNPATLLLTGAAVTAVVVALVVLSRRSTLNHAFPAAR